MQLTAYVDTVERTVSFEEAHALVAGDVYNPFVLDFSKSPVTVKTLDDESLTVALYRTDVEPPVQIAAAVGFTPVPYHPLRRRTVLTLATDAVASWCDDSETGATVQVRMEITDSAHGGHAYVSMDVPLLIVSGVTPSGSSGPVYTKTEVDAMLAGYQPTFTPESPLEFVNRFLRVRTAGQTPGVVRTTSAVTDVSGYDPCPIVDGVPYFTKTASVAGPGVLGLVRTDSTVADVSGYLPTPIVGGVPYYRDTTYGPASGTLGLVRTASSVSDTTGLTPAPIIAGVPYYRYPSVATTVPGLVCTTSPVTSPVGYEPCPIISGVPYYRNDNTTYGMASGSVAGLVHSTSPISDPAGLEPCPIIGGVPYYSPALTGLARVGFPGLMAVSDTTLVPSMRPCTVVDGVPHYEPPQTYPLAGASAPGVVTTTSAVTDVADYTPCPVVDGVPYYKGASVGDIPVAGYNSLGLVQSNSHVGLLDIQISPGTYIPCPIVNGVPYYVNTVNRYGLAGYGVTGMIYSRKQLPESGYVECAVSNGRIYAPAPTDPVEIPLATASTPGLVRSGASSTDITGFMPCPIVDGVPYYAAPPNVPGLATDGVPGLVTSPVSGDVTGFLPCPVVNGVPYYKNSSSQLVPATTELGLVRTVSDVTDSTGWLPVPIVDGVPYYKDTTYGLADGVTPGLVKSTSDAVSTEGYTPCPVFGGVPYFQTPYTQHDLSYRFSEISLSYDLQLSDRAMNWYRNAYDYQYDLVFPDPVTGADGTARSRDFVLVIEEPPAQNTGPGRIRVPSALSFLWTQDTGCPLANDLVRDAERTRYYVYYFTEIKQDVFMVSRTLLTTDAGQFSTH